MIPMIVIMTNDLASSKGRIDLASFPTPQALILRRPLAEKLPHIDRKLTRVRLYSVIAPFSTSPTTR